MSFSLIEVMDHQFDIAKAKVMNTVVENEQLLASIEWKYWNPMDAPVTIGSLWSDAMNVAWKELEHLDKYKLFPQMASFIDTVEDELERLVDHFFEWSNRELIDTKTAAEKYDRSPSTIYRWIKQGKLAAKKVSGRWEIIA